MLVGHLKFCESNQACNNRPLSKLLLKTDNTSLFHTIYLSISIIVDLRMTNAGPHRRLFIALMRGYFTLWRRRWRLVSCEFKILINVTFSFLFFFLVRPKWSSRCGLEHKFVHKNYLRSLEGILLCL